MKVILFAFILIVTLNAGSLEDMLTNGNLGEVEGQRETHTNHSFYPIIFSDYYENTELSMSVAIAENASGQDMNNLQNVINQVNLGRSSASSYEKELKQKERVKISYNKENEAKIYPYFKLTYFPKRAPRFEKIIISFNLDNHREIQNLKFVQKSIFPGINEDFKRAINQARFDFIKNSNEDIVLYYKILYK